MKLGVNVDHVATLRQQRGTDYPDPAVAALLAEYAGASSVVMHLREDRRHIRERDVLLAKKMLKVPLNLEMSINRRIVDFAVDVVPSQATLVPERRQELTTEGGLDLKKHEKRIAAAVTRLRGAGIEVSLFIDPVTAHLKRVKDMGVSLIEINTGRFCEATTAAQKKVQVQKVKMMAQSAKKVGIAVAAGHGLDYGNVKPIARIKQIHELNIGHSIISRSVFVGLVAAVEEMIDHIN